MPIHKDLPDSELHPPKGFLPASNESFPIKNASGLLEWISTSNLGSKWHTGAGIPVPALGSTGDFYLDSDVGDFYEKVNFNTWTLRGNVDGSDWFKGSGPPSSALGRVQDFYIDIAEGDIYEKTAPTVWELITNIDGSDWFQGAGPPAPSLGREQDFYIDKTNGDLYEKNSPTTWNLFGNIAGPQGPPGPMANVSDDTSPELGGNLDGQGHSISNVGTYNGVTVETHAARHAPGGADAIATSAPVAQTPDQANSPGVDAALAKSDHVHNIPTASAVGLDANSPNAQGSNPTFARSNHTHAIASGLPVAQAPDQANASGVAASLAKSDHVHNIPTAVPQSAGEANAQGSANSFARSDHVHNVFPPFQHQDAEINTPQATTAALTTGLTLTTPSIPAGRYKIGWYYEWAYDDIANNFQAQVQVDNTTTLMNQNSEPSDSGGAGPGGTDQRHPNSGFGYVNLAAGIHFIDIDYGGIGPASATLWRARLEIRRVS